MNIPSFKVGVGVFNTLNIRMGCISMAEFAFFRNTISFGCGRVIACLRDCIDEKLDDRLRGEKFVLWARKVRGCQVLCFINDKKMPALNRA